MKSKNEAPELSESSTQIAQLVDHYVFEAGSAEDAWTELLIPDNWADESIPEHSNPA